MPASLAALRAFPESISILDAGSRREGTDVLASKVDYLAASERFAAQAADSTPLSDEAGRRDGVKRLRERYETKVIITLGEKGLVGDDGSGFFAMPAFPVNSIDTTAAGDIFHGAFAYALLEKMPLAEALRFSSAAAALSTIVIGGRKSTPALQAVREFLAK